MMPGNEHNKGASFWDLARLAYPEDREKSLGRNVLPSPLHNVQIPPDEHMLCYDYLYFVGASQVSGSRPREYIVMCGVPTFVVLTGFGVRIRVRPGMATCWQAAALVIADGGAR